MDVSPRGDRARVTALSGLLTEIWRGAERTAGIYHNLARRRKSDPPRKSRNAVAHHPNQWTARELAPQGFPSAATPPLTRQLSRGERDSAGDGRWVPPAGARGSRCTWGGKVSIRRNVHSASLLRDHLHRETGVVRWLLRYYSPVRLPMAVHRCRAPCGFTARTAANLRGRPRDLPGSVQGVSVRAAGSPTARDSPASRANDAFDVAFRLP